VCAGRIYFGKGQDVLIRALALIKQREPRVHVDFIGDGPFKLDCMQLARDLGVEDRCTFLGPAKHDVVLAEMASATATVVPSRSEAFGVVTIESMAVKTPVVASRVGGITEIVRDGVDGLLVTPDDPADLAQKLETLLTQPDLVRRMREGAREGFLSRFEQRNAINEQATWFEAIAARERLRNENNR
jgi:glycosyltransferase involved in cell wall biosynthesis